MKIEKFNFVSDIPYDITRGFNQLKQYLYYLKMKGKNIIKNGKDCKH